MHPVHTVKKRVSIATSKKKVATDIGEEFLEHKQLLLHVQNTLNGYCKRLEESNAAWSGLFKVQRDFVSEMTTAYTRSDAIRATSQQYASNLTSLQSNFMLSDSPDTPFKVLHGTVLKYLKEIADVQKTYPEVEVSYSEYLRYTQKSDRLVAKKNRNEAKIERNMEKLGRSRADYEAKLSATVGTMRAIWEKHPVVFQIAMSSFWLKNDQILRLFADHTGQMHSESDALKAAFMEVNLAQPHTFASLLPSPDGVPLITYPPSSVPERMHSFPVLSQAQPTLQLQTSMPQHITPPPASPAPLGSYDEYSSNTGTSNYAVYLPPARNPEIVPVTSPTDRPLVGQDPIASPPIIRHDGTSDNQARPASERPQLLAA